MSDQPQAPWWRPLFYGVVIFVLFAYGAQVTNINLEEPTEPRRQANLVSLIRELAQPDIFSFRSQIRSVDLDLVMPCPSPTGQSSATEGQRLLILQPNCATTTQDRLTLVGVGMQPNVTGRIVWHPLGSDVPRTISEFRADESGNFTAVFTLPDVRESEDPQRLEVIEVVNRELTGVSNTSQEALDRIIETILMALMASTIGTLLAIPLSFLAARNLMVNVGSPLAAIMLGFILAPIGGYLFWVFGAGIIPTIIAAPIFLKLMLFIVDLVVAAGLVYAAQRREGLGQQLTLLAAVPLLIFAVAALAGIGLIFGKWLEPRLGIFGFVGNFIFVLSDLLRVLLPALLGLVGLASAASFGGRIGQAQISRLSASAARGLTAAYTLVGTAVLTLGISLAANWICLLGVCRTLPENPLPTLLLISSGVGLVVAALSFRWPSKRPFPSGAITYTLVRGMFNLLRSIEPIVIGVVFVVWVGIGPFAGILALTLHSIADLGKLFSEQVENIDEGPLEAITATGANRLQSVVYAVVPQIIPHYLAFIFYRWDINVRLSTIIGFVGGGGIGLVLQRHTNRLEYAQASVMIIAIALVVTLLDNVSSRLRRQVT